MAQVLIIIGERAYVLHVKLAYTVVKRSLKKYAFKLIWSEKCVLKAKSGYGSGGARVGLDRCRRREGQEWSGKGRSISQFARGGGSLGKGSLKRSREENRIEGKAYNAGPRVSGVHGGGKRTGGDSLQGLGERQRL